MKDLAATYSRGSYTTTTIGNAAFDGRVRNGNGSDHSFMATKKTKNLKINPKINPENSLKTVHRFLNNHNSRVEIALLFRGKKAIKPHDRLVLVR
jgi:hypothetical protein